MEESLRSCSTPSRIPLPLFCPATSLTSSERLLSLPHTLPRSATSCRVPWAHLDAARGSRGPNVLHGEEHGTSPAPRRRSDRMLRVSSTMARETTVRDLYARYPRGMHVHLTLIDCILAMSLYLASLLYTRCSQAFFLSTTSATKFPSRSLSRVPGATQDDPRWCVRPQHPIPDHRRPATLRRRLCSGPRTAYVNGAAAIAAGEWVG
ncbi:hypothetical protein C8Q77DRAFT_922834 [Trametes polyzona]|nr:hypothetical protein C8Q77DRAFT_922834 [Trametes polyzona]